MSRSIRRAGSVLAAVLLIAKLASAQTGGELREEFHQTYPLAAGGRVSLKSITGSVRVMTWDRNEVKVDAIKRASTRDELAQAEIKIDASASAVHIKTRYPEDCCFYAEYYREDCCSKMLSKSPYRKLAAVDYVLTIPRGARLEALEVMKGSLTIEGLTGPVIASTLVGSIDATFNQLNKSNTISLTALSGSIRLTLPSNVSAQISAGTAIGAISNDFGLTVRKGEFLGQEVIGKLGEGAARITLDNVSGSVAIRRASDKLPLAVATTLKPQVKDEYDDDAKGARTVAQRIAIKVRQDAARAVREAIASGQVAVIDQREVARAINEALSSGINITLPPIHIPDININPQINIDPKVKVAPKIVPKFKEKPEVVRPERPPRPERTRRRAAADPFRFTYTESKTFSVTGVPSVKVESYEGPIIVRAWDKAEVMFSMSKRARTEESLRAARLRAQQRGSEIVATTDLDHSVENIDGNDVTSHLNVFVPRNANVQLTAHEGGLKVEGVAGELNLHTHEGTIDLVGGRGRLRAESNDGRIQIIGFDGDVEATTNDGTMNLQGRFSSLSARTGDGSISLTVPADFNAIVETVGDSIVFDGLEITEDAESSGRVRRWKIGSGGKLLTLRTGEGRIILRRAQ